MSWKAGQHAIFTLPNKKVQGKTWRPFSIASSPHEGVIRIGTTIPDTPSDFKKKLYTLAPSEKIHMRGPFGEFHAKKSTDPIIGIAGGIGITPFRSIAYEIAHGHISNNLHLIYASPEAYTYGSELQSWVDASPNLSIEFVHTPEEVNWALNEQIHEHHNNAQYYISGSPRMISSLIDACHQKQITRIVNDPFKGY